GRALIVPTCTRLLGALPRDSSAGDQGQRRDQADELNRSHGLRLPPWTYGTPRLKLPVDRKRTQAVGFQLSERTPALAFATGEGVPRIVVVALLARWLGPRGGPRFLGDPPSRGAGWTGTAATSRALGDCLSTSVPEP